MRQKLRNVLLENLDKRISKLLKPDHPVDGWIKTIRTSLGMTQRQLASRLGVAKQSVSNLEMNEKDSSITLKSLRRAADALDCELHYFILPKGRARFKIIREKQSIMKAIKIIESVDQSMLLSSQRVPNNKGKIKRLTKELLEDTSSELWD